MSHGSLLNDSNKYIKRVIPNLSDSVQKKRHVNLKGIIPTRENQLLLISRRRPGAINRFKGF